MSLLSWLFGKGGLPKPSSARDGKWGASENGNAMLISGSTRITVFQQDRGWTYCIADIDDRRPPYFSEPYENEQTARDEALAYFRGEPSRHQSLSALAASNRKQRWEAYILERQQMIGEIRDYLASSDDLNLSLLRKPEAKVASHLKQLERQIAEYRRAGVSDKMISLAESQKVALEKMAARLALSGPTSWQTTKAAISKKSKRSRQG